MKGMMHIQRILGTKALTLPAVLLALCLSTPHTFSREVQIRRRGKQIRTDIRKTVKKPFFACSLAPTATSLPRLQIALLDLITYHEVPIYEALLEIKDEKERDRTKIEYRLIPGEEITGEMSLRQETQTLGPAREMSFLLNDQPITTDHEGIYTDTEQYLVACFDNLRVRERSLTIKHAEMEQVEVLLQRNLVRQTPYRAIPSEGGTVPPDLLGAMGLDFQQKRRPGRDGLSCRVEAPENMRAGQAFRMTIHVENSGKLPTSSLLYRSFSRHDWLNGQTFYFGSIPPKNSRTFFRVIKVPQTAKPEAFFAAMGGWDILGTLPSPRLPLQLNILPPKPLTQPVEKTVNKMP